MSKSISSFLDIPISALQKETEYITEEAGIISVFIDDKTELVLLSSKHNYKDQLLIPPEIKEESDSFLKRKEQEENDRNIRLIEEKLNIGRSIPVPIKPYLTDSYKKEMDNVKHYFGEQEMYDISFSDLNDEDKNIILISNEVHLYDWEKRIENDQNKFDKTINDIKKISSLLLIGFNILFIIFILNMPPPIQPFVLLVLFGSAFLYFFGIKNLNDFEYIKKIKYDKFINTESPEFIRMNDLILPESKKYKTKFNSGTRVSNTIDLSEIGFPLYPKKPTFPTNTPSRY